MTEGKPQQNLSPAHLAGLLQAHAVTLVDVREPAEYAAERIGGSILHPLSRFDPQALPQGPLVFQCGVGRRSLAALQKYHAAGMPPAQHLEGGLAAWKQAGLPTQQG
jgi:rhodanese-related sulfurtransferase